MNNSAYLHQTLRGHGRLRRPLLRGALLVFGGLLASTLLTPQSFAKDPKPKPFKPFKLKTLDGTKKNFADYQGKLTLVAFFYPQCAFCKVSLPHVEKVYEKFKDQGLSVVLINVVEQEDNLIPQYIEEHGLTFPVLTGAWQPSLMRDYDLKATPTHILVGANNAILFRQDGYTAGDEDKLEAKINESLNLAP